MCMRSWATRGLLTTSRGLRASQTVAISPYLARDDSVSFASELSPRMADSVPIHGSGMGPGGRVGCRRATCLVYLKYDRTTRNNKVAPQAVMTIIDGILDALKRSTCGSLSNCCRTRSNQTGWPIPSSKYAKIAITRKGIRLTRSHSGCNARRGRYKDRMLGTACRHRQRRLPPTWCAGANFSGHRGLWGDIVMAAKGLRSTLISGNEAKSGAQPSEALPPWRCALGVAWMVLTVGEEGCNGQGPKDFLPGKLLASHCRVGAPAPPRSFCATHPSPIRGQLSPDTLLRSSKKKKERLFVALH